MMSPLLQKISKEVQDLPQEDKISLINVLLADLDGIEDDPDEIQETWDQEINRRIEIIKSGRVKGIPFDEVLKEAHSILET